MAKLNKQEIYKRLCPHRGLGLENSLDAIKNGIAISPFMVEFDIQLHENDLYIGHPPEITNNKLHEALDLFKATKIMPKIDLKLLNNNLPLALNSLAKKLNEWSPKKALVNIDGNLSSSDFMNAEYILVKKTKETVLLNIDLNRYSNSNDDVIDKHISGLPRRPFSISPNLNDEIRHVTNLAKKYDIKHIHFWSNPDSIYSLEYLLSRLQFCLDQNLDVYFDIKTDNILDS